MKMRIREKLIAKVVSASEGEWKSLDKAIKRQLHNLGAGGPGADL